MSENEEFQHTGRMIRDEVRIEAPPEAIYRAWSDPDFVTGWFVGRMEGRMEAGETVTWRWDDAGPGMTQRVVVADPPHRLVTAMELPQGVSYLEITIEQEGGHSVVRLVQSGFGTGPEWDDQYEAMLSGWLIALAILKFFAERYFGRKRTEIVVLGDAPFEPDQLLALQRTEGGLARWLTRSGSPGAGGESVRLVLADGRTLSGTVLRNTSNEAVWSWDEIDGVLELKAFREPRWGSKVGLRVSSWARDAAELADIESLLSRAVGKLTEVLAQAAG